MILIIIKFCELLVQISPRIINSLRSYMYIKHSKECFLPFPNTSKLVKKTRLRLVFPTYFSVFGNRRKHSSSCLIYYLVFSTFFLKSFTELLYFESHVCDFLCAESGTRDSWHDAAISSEGKIASRGVWSRSALIQIFSNPFRGH